jgi:hypothetical protein
MKLIIASFLIFATTSNASVLVVHAQDGYDYSRKTKSELERIISYTPEEERYFLKNDNGIWFIEQQGVTTESRFGEHQLSNLGSQVTLMGSQLGACIQYAFLDIMNHSRLREITITIPSKAVSTISGDTLNEVFATLSGADQVNEVKRLFSRFPEYLKRKNVEVTIRKNNRDMGKFKMNGNLSRSHVYLNVVD